MQGAGNGGFGAAQGGFESGERQLVDAHRAGHRVAADAFHGVGVAENEPRLRPAEQLVAARGDDRRAVAQPARRVGLVGQHPFGGEQAAADVRDDGDAERREIAHAWHPGEPFDAIVARVDLEHGAHPAAVTFGVDDGVLVVAQMRAIRHAYLDEPGPGRLQQLGQTEAVADLDEFAAADEDVRVPGDREAGEQQCRRAVVDDQCAARVRHPLLERVERCAAALGARGSDGVELDVDVPRSATERLDRGVAERRAPDVGVHDDARCVEDRSQGGGRLGQAQCDGRVDAVGADGARADVGLGRDDGALHSVASERAYLVGEACEELVGARDASTWVVARGHRSSRSSADAPQPIGQV